MTKRDRTGSAASPRTALLGDIIDTPELSGALVLGTVDPGLPIAAVVLVDEGAPVERDALVLSPGAPPDPVPEGCALIICRAAPVDPVSVPVLVLPAGTPWGPIVAAVSARLGSAEARRPARAARSAFRGPLLGGGGFPALAAAAREVLGSPVALLDEYLDILGSAGLSEQESARLGEGVTRARGHGPASFLGPFLERSLTDLVRAPIVGARGPTGVIIVFASAPARAGQQAALAELVEAFLMEQSREHLRTETESRLRGDLLDELAAGEAVGRESVVRRARHLGADLAPGGMALVGQLQDPHDQGRIITDPHLVRRFMKQARGAIQLNWPNALVDWWHEGLVSVLPHAPGQAVDDVSIVERGVRLAGRLLAATKETAPGTALTVGLSRYTREPERLGIALEEARLALAIGERLGRIGELTTFEETGTYKLLFQLFADRPAELRTFYESTIGPLVEYDLRSQTELVNTLSTYLGNDGNLAVTARSLYTHRHTVRYRLDRISKLCGLSVGRTDDREKLSLGLKTMRLLGVKTPMLAARAEAPAQAGRTSKP